MIAERPDTIAVSPDLALEAALALPAGASAGVVVCHPHPLYGGDMDSPVVLAIAQACAEAGLATLRFNFRGVGGSGGAWDEGRSEQDDVRAALAHLQARLPATARPALAGNAQYWIGEGYVSQARAAANAGQTERMGQELESSVQEFRKVLANYPRSEKAPSALYKEALALIDLKQPAVAQQRLEYLVANFPQAEETPLARERLTTLKTPGAR